MDKMKLKELFVNNTNCYASTWWDEHCPAMTIEKFVEVVSALFPTDQEIQAMAEKEYPTINIEPQHYMKIAEMKLQRTAFIKGCNAIIKRGKDE